MTNEDLINLFYYYYFDLNKHKWNGSYMTPYNNDNNNMMMMMMNKNKQSLNVLLLHVTW